jgi:spermidine synthase
MLNFRSLLSILKPIIISSKYHENIKVGYAYGKKTLFTGAVHQSGGEYHFMWKKVFETIKPPKHVIKNCLVLGVGAGTVIPFIKNNYPESNIIGVEIDPQMVAVAKHYFGIGKIQDFQFVIEDAVHYVKTSKKIFDLIVIDLFIGELNPPKTRTAEFMKMVKKHLQKDGIVIVNSHYQETNKQEYKQFFGLCKTLFNEVKEVFSYPKNRVLVMLNS